MRQRPRALCNSSPVNAHQQGSCGRGLEHCALPLCSPWASPVGRRMCQKHKMRNQPFAHAGPTKGSRVIPVCVILVFLRAPLGANVRWGALPLCSPWASPVGRRMCQKHQMRNQPFAHAGPTKGSRCNPSVCNPSLGSGLLLYEGVREFPFPLRATGKV